MLIRVVVQGASGPSAPILHTDGGWAGFILDNTQGNASISITALGRYKVPVSFQPDLYDRTLLVRRCSVLDTTGCRWWQGNKQSHRMNVWDVSAAAWMISTSGKTPAVDMQSCVPDALGFCYSPPLGTALTLEAGKRYYIAAEEHEGGDAYAEMTDSATSTDFSVRDGRTFMSYRKPAHGVVAGRARRGAQNTTWTLSEAGGHDLDTSFGPVNYVGP